jgi:hypothetical protein
LKEIPETEMTKKTKLPEELENEAEEVVNEADHSEAAKTLHPGSRPFDDPKSRIETLRSVIGSVASMSSTELTKWWEQAVDLIGHEADKVGEFSEKNKESVGMKPSDAVGHSDGSGTFKMPQVSVKEDLDVLFGADETLTEEAKETMTTLFEAAVTARVILEREELEDQYTNALEESASEIRSEIEDQLNSYLDYCASQFIQENELAIVSTLRTELAEEFIDRMHGLFAEHFISVPDDKVDLVETLASRVEELENSLNSAIVENNDLRGVKIEADLDDVFDEVATDLSDAQKEKLAALAEGIEIEDGDLETFEKKLTVIKENYFPASSPAHREDDFEGTGEVLTEEVTVDPKIETYANAMRSMFGKS